MFAVVFIIYMPLSDKFHIYLRKKKFDMLSTELYERFPPQFWGDKGDNKTMRLGCSTRDY